MLAELPGHALVPGSSVTLRFEEGRADGSEGCNRFGYAYATTAPKLEFKPGGMSTQMACAPELMEQASASTAILDGARTYRVESGQLRLLGADGAVAVALHRTPAR